MSTAALLATDAYLRPGEIESLKGDSLVPPRRAPFYQWALHLFPREGGIASKTQQHDDTIILDSSSRPWLGPLVNLIARTRKRDEKLFSFTIDAWRKQLRAAAQRLQVVYQDITPHVIRHSGPSNDRACNVSSPLRKVSTSLTLGGRLPCAGPRQDSGARSKSACEPDASKPQRTRREACTAQTFAERRCGSPHFQALKGRTAVVLMDAGAPFAKAVRCFGLVVHSCPLETLRLPQARDRISRLCLESLFVVYAIFYLTYIDRVSAVRDSNGKPWPDTSSRTKGRCRTEDRIFAWVATLWLYLSLRGVLHIFVASAKCSLWSINSIQRAFESTKATLAWHDSSQHGTRFKSTLKVACANLLNVLDNSLLCRTTQLLQTKSSVSLAPAFSMSVVSTTTLSFSDLV